MAWTAPATWVSGAILTAAQLNTQLRDNLLSLGGVCLNTTTISASTWTIDSIFTTTYRSYLLIFEYYGSTAAAPSMRLRAGGSPSITGYYMAGNLVSYAAASALVADSNQAQWSSRMGHTDTGSGTRCTTIMTLTDPAFAVNTTINGSFNDARTNGQPGTFQGFHNSAVAYDGFTFYNVTMTGTVNIYGMQSV